MTLNTNKDLENVKSSNDEQNDTLGDQPPKDSNTAIEKADQSNIIIKNKWQTKADIFMIFVKYGTIVAVIFMLVFTFVYWLLCLSHIVENPNLDDLTILMRSVFFIMVGYAFRSMIK